MHIMFIDMNIGTVIIIGIFVINMDIFLVQSIITKKDIIILALNTFRKNSIKKTAIPALKVLCLVASSVVALVLPLQEEMVAGGQFPWALWAVVW